MNEFLKDFDEISQKNSDSLRFYEEICRFSPNSSVILKGKLTKNRGNSNTYETFVEKRDKKPQMYYEFPTKVPFSLKFPVLPL